MTQTLHTKNYWDFLFPPGMSLQGLAFIRLCGRYGLRPALEQKVIINPLVPESWEFFSLENVSFCGFELSLFFSRDKGVTFLVDGKETALKRDGKGNLFWQRADHDKIGEKFE